LLEGADACHTEIRSDHASLLSILGQKDVPVCRATGLTFEGYLSRAVLINRVRTIQSFALNDRMTQRGLFARKSNAP
jgi:hypothetical protein